MAASKSNKLVQLISTTDRYADYATAWAIHDARLSARIIPAGLAANGGDWCEAFRLSDDVMALSIGDVCGHGADRASAMMLIRQCICDAAYAGLPPDEVLTAANRFVCARGLDFFSTALFALLNTKLMTITFANCGHPAPLVIDAHQAHFLAYMPNDLALGIDALAVLRCPLIRRACAIVSGPSDFHLRCSYARSKRLGRTQHMRTLLLLLARARAKRLLFIRDLSNTINDRPITAQTKEEARNGWDDPLPGV